jgi:hypothetical protein
MKMKPIKYSHIRYVHLVLIALLGLAVYSNTFSVPFHFDDVSFIKENPYIKDIDYFLEPSKVAEGAEINLDVIHFKARRVGFLSLWANYKLNGLDVRGYHALNIAIHIVNSILVYLIVLLTFRTPALAGSRLKERSGFVALFSGLLFVSHPIQTEAVTYTFQRMGLLATMFYLLSTCAYVSSRLSEKKWRMYGLYTLALVSSALGMMTKENVFTLPIAIALYEVMFLRGGIKKRAALLAPLFIAMIIPFAAIGKDAFSCFYSTGFSWMEYLFTQFSVITSYIGLVLFPVGQNVDHYHPIYRSLLEPTVILSLVFLIGILVLGVYVLMRSFRGEAAGRLSAFGIFFFFLALSVESSVLPLREIMVEYRIYLPSSGFISAGVVLAVILLDGLNKRHALAGKFMVSVLVIIVIVMSLAAYQRNSVWASETRLWKDAAEKSPRKHRPQFNLARAYHAKGMTKEAIYYFEKAMEITPFDEDTHYNLAIAYSDVGMKGKTEKHYKEAIRLNPRRTRARFNLAIMYVSQGRMEPARRELEQVLELEPGHRRARKFLDYVKSQQAR